MFKRRGHDDKIYLSRAQTRAMSIDHPIGDPTGGTAYGEYKDPVTAAISSAAVLSFLGSQNQADAAQSSAQLQADAANNAAAQQMQMFNIQNAQQQPYREAGYSGLNAISSMMPYFNQQPQAYRPFTAADLNANLAPNYQFMRDQGIGAVGESMNVGGGGSNVDLAKTKFAEDYAGNAYQNALNNYMTQQQQGFNQQQASNTGIFNRLASIAGIGQTAQNQTATLAQNTTNAIGQLGVGAAGAIGAGQVGAANATAGAFGNIGNQAFLSSMLRPQTAAVTPSLTPSGPQQLSGPGAPAFGEE
jgi:hypothetical protein